MVSWGFTCCFTPDGSLFHGNLIFMYEGALKFISGMFVCFRFSAYQTTSLCVFTQHSLPLVIKKRSESVYMRRFTPVFFHVNALYNYKNERLQKGVTCSRSVRHVVHVKPQEENPKSSDCIYFSLIISQPHTESVASS